MTLHIEPGRLTQLEQANIDDLEAERANLVELLEGARRETDRAYALTLAARHACDQIRAGLALVRGGLAEAYLRRALEELEGAAQIETPSNGPATGAGEQHG